MLSRLGEVGGTVRESRARVRRRKGGVGPNVVLDFVAGIADGRNLEQVCL